MSIASRIEDIQNNIDKCAKENGKSGDDILLLAVTKTRSADEINEAIEAGITDIGENKVQEIMDKHEAVKPVRWHMIGHLQTNKVKYIIDKVAMIHSVDSVKLAAEIDKRAEKSGITMDILIQVNAADEESKFGVSTDEAEPVLREILEKYENIRIRGLMSIAPAADNPNDIRIYFRQVHELYDKLAKVKHEHLDFKYLSMGMSHDYPVAIAEGSNLVRIGTDIFGARNYTNV